MQYDQQEWTSFDQFRSRNVPRLLLGIGGKGLYRWKKLVLWTKYVNGLVKRGASNQHDKNRLIHSKRTHENNQSKKERIR